ncbi:MAG: metallophosphoesterase family protein [Candidatus Binatia bacterium]
MSSFVIGDIHGCSEELRHLVDALPVRPGDELVFLGDYIDRGPDSSGVVSFLIELKASLSENKLVFLKGNHEDMLLSYLELSGRHGKMFLLNGGRATMQSYGFAADNLSPTRLQAALPPAHLAFYQALQSYYLSEPYLCVHAGIHPRKSLQEQTDEELLWIREPFLHSSHTLPYTILFGHTPQHSVLYHLPYKIGLDTGLVYGNMLTCLDTDEKILYQIGRGKNRVSKTSVQQKWSAASTTFK